MFESSGNPAYRAAVRKKFIKDEVQSCKREGFYPHLTEANLLDFSPLNTSFRAQLSANLERFTDEDVKMVIRELIAEIDGNLIRKKSARVTVK